MTDLKSKIKEVCINCEYSFYGYGESSLNYGLRCSMKDDVSVDEKDSCKGFEVNNYYKVKQLNQELQKTREQLEKAEKVIEFYHESAETSRFDLFCGDKVSNYMARRYFKDKQGE